MKRSKLILVLRISIAPANRSIDVHYWQHFSDMPE